MNLMDKLCFTSLSHVFDHFWGIIADNVWLSPDQYSNFLLPLISISPGYRVCLGSSEQNNYNSVVQSEDDITNQETVWLRSADALWSSPSEHRLHTQTRTLRIYTKCMLLANYTRSRQSVQWPLQQSQADNINTHKAQPWGLSTPADPPWLELTKGSAPTFSLK